MLRVVVAVVLSVSLLSVTLPAMETAGEESSARRVEADLDRLRTAINDVHAREAATRGGPGARRVVTVRIPASTWTSGGVEYVALGGPPGDDGDSRWDIVWQLSGNETPERQRVGPPVAVDSESSSQLVLRDPGTHQIAVSLVERRANRTVVLDRLD